MEGILAALRLLSEEDLLKLKEEIDRELKERLKSQNVFEFKVEYTNDPRKGVPYAARITGWNPTKRQFVRSFYPLNKHWGKKEVTVEGKITASPGEIIEIREGGSWKNDYRYFFVVTREGKLKCIGSARDSQAASLVRKYICGELTYEELLKEAEK